jgi:hypothetical protein
VTLPPGWARLPGVANSRMESRDVGDKGLQVRRKLRSEATVLRQINESMVMVVGRNVAVLFDANRLERELRAAEQRARANGVHRVDFRESRLRAPARLARFMEMAGCLRSHEDDVIMADGTMQSAESSPDYDSRPGSRYSGLINVPSPARHRRLGRGGEQGCALSDNLGDSDNGAGPRGLRAPCSRPDRAAPAPRCSTSMSSPAPPRTLTALDLGSWAKRSGGRPPRLRPPQGAGPGSPPRLTGDPDWSRRPSPLTDLFLGKHRSVTVGPLYTFGTCPPRPQSIRVRTLAEPLWRSPCTKFTAHQPSSRRVP